jgi:hypothetical protein
MFMSTVNLGSATSCPTKSYFLFCRSAYCPLLRSEL